MTNREFYTAIAALENIDAELVEKASDLIAKMDEANAKRADKPRKVSEETLAKRNAIFGALTSELLTASALADLTGYSKNTVAGVLKAFVADSKVIKEEVSITEDGKTKKVKAYKLA